MYIERPGNNAADPLCPSLICGETGCKSCNPTNKNLHIISNVTWSLNPGPDSRNDPLAIGSDTILWSWSADRIPQTLITIGAWDREDTKPNSLLPIESWHTSFTGKFRIEITWLWSNKKRQTNDIYSWRHNGRCGDVIYECQYESVMASSVHAIDLARNGNSGCANEILGCAKCDFWWKSPWKWEN